MSRSLSWTVRPELFKSLNEPARALIIALPAVISGLLLFGNPLVPYPVLFGKPTKKVNDELRM